MLLGKTGLINTLHYNTSGFHNHETVLRKNMIHTYNVSLLSDTLTRAISESKIKDESLMTKHYTSCRYFTLFYWQRHALST